MSIDGMQKRFHELGSQRDHVIATAGPANAVRDAIRGRIADLERMTKALTVEIKRIEDPLFEIDMERGRLVRALKGKTGVAPPSKVKPMDADEIAALIKSLKLNGAVTLQVDGGKATGPDPRIDAAMDAIRELSDRISALPKPQAVQPFDSSPIYADMKNLAEAVQIHDAKLVEVATIAAKVDQIASDLGSFYTLIDKAKA